MKTKRASAPSKTQAIILAERFVGAVWVDGVVGRSAWESVGDMSLFLGISVPLGFGEDDRGWSGCYVSVDNLPVIQDTGQNHSSLLQFGTPFPDQCHSGTHLFELLKHVFLLGTATTSAPSVGTTVRAPDQRQFAGVMHPHRILDPADHLERLGAPGPGDQSMLNRNIPDIERPRQ